MAIPAIYIDVTDPQLAVTSAPPLTTKPLPDLAHPHQLLTQTAPKELQEELIARAARLPGIELRDSCVSVPGARTAPR